MMQWNRVRHVKLSLISRLYPDTECRSARVQECKSARKKEKEEKIKNKFGFSKIVAMDKQLFYALYIESEELIITLLLQRQ